MSLESTSEVDAIGTEKDGGSIVLTIIDSWDWSDEPAHLQALQAKLNTYFAFVETGEIFAAYPNAAGHRMRIEVVCRYAPPTNAVALLLRASDVASQLGVAVAHRVHEG